jgi:predicted DNA binding protein
MEEQLSINHVEVSTYIPLFKSNLNNKELQVLQKAFENGFFDFPRKVSVKELSKSLNMNESTLIYYLRRAERKLIKSIMDSEIDEKNKLT